MKYEKKINYYETDRMGITHHSNYIRYAEEARGDILDKIGLPYSKIESEKVLIPVLEVKCKFKHSTTFEDIIVIDVKIKEFNGIRITFEYTMTKKETNDVVAIMESTHCFTDEHLKPINIKKIKPDWYEIIDKLEKLEKSEK